METMELLSVCAKNPILEELAKLYHQYEGPFASGIYLSLETAIRIVFGYKEYESVQPVLILTDRILKLFQPSFARSMK